MIRGQIRHPPCPADQQPHSNVETWNEPREKRKFALSSLDHNLASLSRVMSSTALYAALAGAIVGVGATLVLSPDSALSRRAPAQAPPVGVDAPRRSGVPSVRSNAGDGVIVHGSIGTYGLMNASTKT